MLTPLSSNDMGVNKKEETDSYLGSNVFKHKMYTTYNAILIIPLSFCQNSTKGNHCKRTIFALSYL